MASTTSKGSAPHTSSNKLEDQAATAALYVTRKKEPKPSHPLLDEDGKLSSASAATSLKYANAQDLPSYPSSGLQMSSAGAAASIANSNQKTFEHWKPGAIPAAERAAFLAKDYEADPLWHPDLSAASSKAALLASRDGKRLEVWRPSESEEGQSAAGQALKMKDLSPTVDRSVPTDAGRKALLAATGAMAGSRRRADSAPIKPQVDAGYALRAATSSQKSRGHQPKQPSFGSGDPGLEASRIQHMAQTKASRQMYTSNPPVALEVEEKNRQDTIRASAIAMAQKMYAIQQSAIDEAKTPRRSDSHYAANHVHGRRPSETASVEEPVSHPQYLGLEEAARKLAQERLDKLRDEHQEYRDYYGQSTAPRSRLSVHGRLRRRASSDPQLDNIDEEQSRKIRSQMSIFQSKVAEVDSKKRQTDRDTLLAAAQRNVTASMANMDDKVFQETGKSSPAQRDDWEKKARERAQADSDTRMEHYGKVHIGGGKYLEQSEVDAVARARIQPTLDDISAKAEAQRAHDEETRLELERKKREEETEKTRAADTKAELKRAREAEKQEERNRKAEEKRVQREEAAAQKERARAEKEEKRKSRDNKNKVVTVAAPLDTGDATAATTDSVPEATEGSVVAEFPARVPSITDSDHGNLPSVHRKTTYEQTTSEPSDLASLTMEETPALSPGIEEAESGEPTPRPGSPVAKPVAPLEEPAPPVAGVASPVTTPTSPVATPTAPTAEPTSPIKGDSKVKSWLGRFRRSSKPVKDSKEGKESEETEAKKPGFIGGAALTGPSVSEGSASAGDEGAREDSMREVAMVGRASRNKTDDLYVADKSPSISPPSSNYEENEEAGETETRGRRGFKERLLGKTLSKESEQTADDTEFEEARDTFEEEKLSPPPILTTVMSGGSSGKSAGSPMRDKSKFTEVL